MIIETLILGGVLYTGYTKLKKIFSKENIYNSIEDNNFAPVEKNIQDSEIMHNDSYKKSTFFNTGKRDFKFALTGLTLATGGALFYWALSFASIPFLLYSTRLVYKDTYNAVKKGKPDNNMMASITFGGCIILGYFFIASLAAVIITLATVFISNVTENSREKMFNIFDQNLDFVWILVDGIEMRIPFNKLQTGDVAVVHAGEIIPADGVIIKGVASIDQHILTGEAMPVEKSLREEVFAATIILSGKINIKVKRAGEESTAAKITDILNNTVEFKSSVEFRALLFSNALVAPILIAGGAALPLLGFSRAVAVINAHPKEKMALITPLTVIIYMNLASKNGILIKDGRSIELLYKVDTIVFDKTGTLTKEQPEIGAIHTCSDYSENDILIYAATAEYKQKHPLAKAILEETEKRHLNVFPIEDSKYKLGYGIMVNVDEKNIYAGSERFMNMEGINIPFHIKKQQAFCLEQGHTLILIAIDKDVIGAIELVPAVRSEAKMVIDKLKQRTNIKTTYIISGDHEIPTKKLAAELDIDYFFAETLPEEKADIIEQLHNEGHFICYIGDGINDSIALKKSQVSVSLTGASSVATDTASIILMDQGLNHLNFLFDLADDFHNNMNRTFIMTLIPAVIGVTGAFLLGFTLIHTIILNLIALGLTLGNTMVPMLLSTDLYKNSIGAEK